MASIGTYIHDWTNTGNKYFVATTAGTFTLEDASLRPGVELVIKNNSTGTLVVACSGSQTIDGVATISMATQYDYLRLFSTGSGWSVCGRAALAADLAP